MSASITNRPALLVTLAQNASSPHKRLKLEPTCKSEKRDVTISTRELAWISKAARSHSLVITKIRSMPCCLRKETWREKKLAHFPASPLTSDEDCRKGSNALGHQVDPIRRFAPAARIIAYLITVRFSLVRMGDQAVIRFAGRCGLNVLPETANPTQNILHNVMVLTRPQSAELKKHNPLSWRAEKRHSMIDAAVRPNWVEI